MTRIVTNLQAVRERVARAAQASGRSSEDVRIVAVSKTWTAESVRVAAAAGQHSFGENYVQEGVAKTTTLADFDLDWHFIGPLQSNKTRLVADSFSWVHSIEREKIARRLSEQRDASLPPLNVCLQINVSGEASKSGVAPSRLEALADEVASLPRLKLRGLMCIPEPSPDTDLLRRRFAFLRELGERLTACGHAIDTLSMGMSNDFELAILEGSTLVRIGSAIFGARPNVLNAENEPV
ncbi:MAG TPA: YggS family pyridoxal phosphate-dependent enzyme [Azoarcus sp.]|nr:YggS family pyridoxal phosphate-dependent enzyme [Azoarcus sp.]